MEGDELRERAVESLARQRRFSILFTAYVGASFALIAVWGLTGDGYFWPGWAMVAGALAFLALWAARNWSDREFSDVAIRTRTAQIGGGPPSGIQR
jgi:protein-S-isoprenylcysteine O-methyltransferase Ste14